MAQSAAFLKKLRKKFHLGEYSKGARGRAALEKKDQKREQNQLAAKRRNYPVRRRKPKAPKIVSPYSIFGKTGGTNPFHISPAK